VEAAVDPDDGLAFGRELAGFVFGDAIGQGEFARDLLITVQLL